MSSTNVQRPRYDRAPASRPPYLMPSYASPTISSTAKSLPHSSTVSPSPPTRPPKRSSPPRDFKTYALSTKASRSRSRSIGVFRFLALPADVRNIVYDYVFADYPNMYIRYASSKARRKDYLYRGYAIHSRMLPALFRVPNKQIRYEIGGYIFSDGKLIFGSTEKRGLVDLLHFIGYANVRRLLGNPKPVLFELWIHVPWADLPIEIWNGDCEFSWDAVRRRVDVKTLWRMDFERIDEAGSSEGGSTGDEADDVEASKTLASMFHLI